MDSCLELLEHQVHLEKLVKERTQELTTVNENLKQAQVKRERLESQLRQVYKMESIGKLAVGIAHDFNNILTSVIAFTELTMMSVKKDSSVHHNMTHVLSTGRHGKELIQQILTFSRQDEKKLKPVMVKPLVKEVLKLIRVSLPSTIKIDQNFKGDPLIMADSKLIHQVLMNLCTNAGHAMEKNGGTLLVELQSIEIDKENSLKMEKIKPGQYVCLTISDTGCGMTSEVKQRIFNPFFTTKEHGHGTGMGLFVVYGIISGFGGAIIVYSEPGKGSSFKLFSPAMEHFGPYKKNSSNLREKAILPKAKARFNLKVWNFTSIEPVPGQINKGCVCNPYHPFQ